VNKAGFISPVQSGVPLPDAEVSKTGNRPVYPFAEMVVGDMFETNIYNIDYIARAWAHRRKLKWKFAIRQLDNGRLGLWRVE
jgi:hypothetical protein